MEWIIDMTSTLLYKYIMPNIFWWNVLLQYQSCYYHKLLYLTTIITSISELCNISIFLPQRAAIHQSMNNFTFQIQMRWYVLIQCIGLAFGFQTRSGSLRLVDAHLVIRRFSASPSDPSQKAETDDMFPLPHRKK